MLLQTLVFILGYLNFYQPIFDFWKFELQQRNRLTGY